MSGSSIDSRRRVGPTAPAPPLAPPPAPAPQTALSPPAQLVAANASTNRAPSSNRIAGAAVCKRGGGRAGRVGVSPGALMAELDGGMHSSNQRHAGQGTAHLAAPAPAYRPLLGNGRGWQAS